MSHLRNGWKIYKFKNFLNSIDTVLLTSRQGSTDLIEISVQAKLLEILDKRGVATGGGGGGSDWRIGRDRRGGSY
jgi:hypothetical protein